MSKAAATNKTTTDKGVVKDEVELLADSIAAKQQFVGSTLNMGWRLAITVVIPIVGGVKLDDHFHSAPSWTLTGLFLAAFAGSMAVWTTIKEVNKEQAEDELEKKLEEKNK
jgi:predicted F0F1-ATPase subunit